MFHKKLRIRNQEQFTLINSNSSIYYEFIDQLPGRKVQNYLGKSESWVMLFASNIEELENYFLSIYNVLAEDSVFWVCFPKKSSGFQTNLTRDHGWDHVNSSDIDFSTLVSFNDDWSAFLFSCKSKNLLSKTRKRDVNKILNYDPKTKGIFLPLEMETALIDHPELLMYFNALAFSHKKEYVDWIVGAKKVETRESRLKKMIDLLYQKKKNPHQKP
jgi:hypothetical protein